MDAFKLTVLAAVMATLIAFGVIILVAQDAITYSTAPDVERGLVSAKAVITDKPTANYAVYLSDGKVLYIYNDEELYNSIVENNTYVFDSKIDFNNHMLMVQSVNPQAGIVTSKALLTDKPQVSYAINLANGKTLYIASNATLYNEIMVNQKYLFDCQTNYADNSQLINSVQPIA